MFSQYSLRKQFQKLLGGYKRMPSDGGVWYIGDENGTVYPDTTNLNIINVINSNGIVRQVYNQRVPNSPGYPVKIGIDDSLPRITQVIDFVPAYGSTPPLPAIPPGISKVLAYGGIETLFIYDEQIIPGLVTGNSGLTITIYPLYYRKSDGTWDGITSKTTLDLTAYQPASGAIAVGIFVKDDETLAVVNGTTESTPEIITPANWPAAPDSTYHAICVVRLFSGQTVIRQNATVTDIYLQRWSFGAGAGGGSVTAGDGIAVSGAIVSQNIDNGTVVTSLADADELGTWNAVATAFRKITWANVKASIKTYTDTLYVALSTAFSGDGSGAFPALTVQSSHWNTQSVSAAATLVDGSAPVVLTDTTSTAFTLKLPATPTAKSWFWIVDDTGKWSTNNLTLDPNGKNINGSSSTIVLRTQYAVVRVYFDGTQWILIGQTYPAPIIDYFDHMLGTTVAAGTTVYLCPFIDAVQTVSRGMPILHPGVVKNLYVRLTGSQPASGSLVITVQIGGGNTTIQITIPAGGGGVATYTDLTHTAINAAGDYIGFSIVNNATAASAPIGFVVVEVQPTG